MPEPLDLDIAGLLALDPARHDEAMRLRVGIARLAWWQSESVGGVLRWYQPGNAPVIYDELPHFESSLDAALTLLDPKRYFQLSTNVNYPGLFWAQIATRDGIFAREEGCESAALAVCRAWLRYESARRERSASEPREG